MDKNFGGYMRTKFIDINIKKWILVPLFSFMVLAATFYTGHYYSTPEGSRGTAK